MDNKIINWKEEFIKLFPENTERQLKDNHKWCEKCNGLGFFRQGIYIDFCNSCRGTGQIELCTEGCGREKNSPYTVCDICRAKKDFEKETAKEKELFEKAQKVKFADYEGMFLKNERVIDKEDFADDLYYKIKDEEEYPMYVYGTYKEPVMSIDFNQVINDSCEEGYEDMTDQLDYDGVEEIQKSIDQWIEKQGEANYCYYESNVVVLLDDLIVEIKEAIAIENMRRD